jgi:hypothetical protein
VLSYTSRQANVYLAINGAVLGTVLEEDQEVRELPNTENTWDWVLLLFHYNAITTNLFLSA